MRKHERLFASCIGGGLASEMLAAGAADALSLKALAVWQLINIVLMTAGFIGLKIGGCEYVN